MSSFHFNQEGGIERASYEIAARLSDRVDMTLVSSDVQPAPEPPLQWHRVPPPSGPSFFIPSSYSAAATRSLRGSDFDILHNQGGCALREQDIITAHSCHRAWWTMKFRQGEAVRAIANPFHHTVLRVEKANYRSGAFRRVIAVSAGVGREVTEHYGVPPELITVVPNAVDAHRFQPSDAAERRSRLRAEHGIAEDDVVLLFVGKEFRRKGLAPIIEALPHLPDSARLLVVGGDDTGPFERLARQLGVSSRVVFAGHSPRVEDYFQAGDVFVLPSRYEPFGLVMLEAAAAGLPIVATPFYGAVDFVSEGHNGAFIEHESTSIAGALRPLVENPALRATWGARAREDVRRYTWDAVADQTLAVYEEVWAQKQAAGGVSPPSPHA